MMKTLLKEDNKTTILIVGDKGTTRFRVRPSQLKQVEELLSNKCPTSKYPIKR